MTDTESREIPLKLRLAAAGYPLKKRKRQEPRTLLEINLAAIREAVAAFGGHRGKAAKRLGISEATLSRWLKRMKANNAPEGEEVAIADCPGTAT
jgi:DNA-binding NtrC family response regulator